MKIISVVGARPQFIKAAVLSRVIRKEFQEILVHTGQHFDKNMSDVFFDELNIPVPDYNLGISGGSHAKMTGAMMIALEDVFLKEKADAVLLYGDTNSTLAAALAAVKIHIPVIHVEAGNRFNTLDSPEEINRICTDHVSSLRFACVKSAYDYLCKENLSSNSYISGDPMYDAFVYFGDKISERNLYLNLLNGSTFSVPKDYYYLTCHRQENTTDTRALEEILGAMDSLDYPTVYPVHPRNKEKVFDFIDKYKNIIFCEPIGYLESISLVKNSKKVVTDSGGIQREAFFAQKQCVTVLDFVVWPETMYNNVNVIVSPLKEEILSKLSEDCSWPYDYRPFGDGHSCEFICSKIENFFKG